MSEQQILDWIQFHVTHVTRTRLSDKSRAFQITWVDRDGNYRLTYGLDLRDCVRGAVIGE